MNQNQLTELSANKLFSKEKIWKLNLKVVFPSLLISLLFGIFIFADQIIMQQLIPKDGINYSDLIYSKFAQEDAENIKIIIYQQKDVTVFQLNRDLIISAVSTVGVSNLIILAMGLFINTGSSVLYSRQLSKNNDIKIISIFRNSFYGTIISSLVIMAIILGLQEIIIRSTLPDALNSANDATNKFFSDGGSETAAQMYPTEAILFSDKNYVLNLLTEYYKYRNDAITNLSNKYLTFISISIFFVSILNLYIFFLRAEGKNFWITIFNVVANILNIVFDVILIYLLKLGMMGSGIATLLGYILNLVATFVYVIILEKKSETFLAFKNLKKFEFKIKIIFISFVLGLGTFLRDLSLAVANILYLPVWYKTVTATGWASIVTDVGGVSATPIYNLVFFAIFGIIDGMRPIIAYNYANKNYERVKKSFYSGIITSLIYAVIVNVIVYIPTYISVPGNQFLEFLGATNSDGSINEQRQKILEVLIPSMMLQLPFLALTVSGLGIYQSTGKMWMNIFLSIMQGIITFFPILYGISAASIAINSWELMFYTGFINIAISSIIIFVISLVYIYFYMGKKEKYNDPNVSLDNALNKIFGFRKKKKIFVK